MRKAETCSLKSAVWTEAGQLHSMRMRSDGNLRQSSSQLLAVLQGAHWHYYKDTLSLRVHLVPFKRKKTQRRAFNKE